MIQGSVKKIESLGATNEMGEMKLAIYTHNEFANRIKVAELDGEQVIVMKKSKYDSLMAQKPETNIADLMQQLVNIVEATKRASNHSFEAIDTNMAMFMDWVKEYESKEKEKDKEPTQESD